MLIIFLKIRFQDLSNALHAKGVYFFLSFHPMEDNKTSKMQGIVECERMRNKNIIKEREQ